VRPLLLFNGLPPQSPFGWLGHAIGPSPSVPSWVRNYPRSLLHQLWLVLIGAVLLDVCNNFLMELME
jgi:hypothetical protein